MNGGRMTTPALRSGSVGGFVSYQIRLAHDSFGRGSMGRSWRSRPSHRRRLLGAGWVPTRYRSVLAPAIVPSPGRDLARRPWCKSQQASRTGAAHGARLRDLVETRVERSGRARRRASRPSVVKQHTNHEGHHSDDCGYQNPEIQRAQSKDRVRGGASARSNRYRKG